MEFGTHTDEIKQYLDACYVSSCEAIWRLYLFAMQEHHPTVVCLQVHLPGQQSVILNPEGRASIQDVVEAQRNKDTTLTAWFKANAQSEANRDILYQDFPSKMVWNDRAHRWTIRRPATFAIGRMYHAHPTSGECFYLCLLLTCIKGATSDDLCTVDGVPCGTFKEACFALALLDDDKGSCISA